MVAVTEKEWSEKDPISVEQFKNLKIDKPTLDNPSKAVASNYYPPQPSSQYYADSKKNKNLSYEKQINQPRRFSQ